MDAQRLSQQPDFRVVADNLRTVSDHIERCGNLPAIEGGRHLLEAVQALTVQMQQFQLEVRREFENLRRRTKVTEYNNIYRMENSTAVRRDAEIVPLLSVDTGEVIDRFPQTVDGLLTATSVEVNRLLFELGVPTSGGLPERRRRLLLVTGVTTRAV